MTKGRWLAIGAYTIWGLMPLYWKLLQNIPSIELLIYRILFAFIFALLILTVTKNWGWIKPLLKKRKVLLTFTLSGTLLGINWFVFLWAVTAGYVVDASLGYFINPLINVIMGLLFLKERLRLGQWLAVGVATAGVLYLTFGYGAFPWIALTLAFSFAFYGFIRKTAPLNSAEGFSIEMALLSLVGLGAITYLIISRNSVMATESAATWAILAFSGPATAIPLLLFAAGARRVTLTTLGILQYIAPTLQFLLGVYVFGEIFDQNRLLGFALVWAALFIYLGEGIMAERRKLALKTASHY